MRRLTAAVDVTVCLFVIAGGVLFQSEDAYEILLIPAPIKSHVFPIAAIGKGLADRGHNVTMLLGRSFPYEVNERDRQSNFHLERYEDFETDYLSLYDEVFNEVLEKAWDVNLFIVRLKQMFREICRHMTAENNPVFRKFNSTGFDLAVVDGPHQSKCAYMIPHRLNIPVITYSDFMEPSLIGLPWLPSDVPYSSTGLTNRMTFLERVKNTFVHVVLASYDVFSDMSEGLIDRYQQYGSFQSYDELAGKTLLWLYPRDPVLDYPTPSLPNFVSVGGLTVSFSTSAMSDDLKSFVESARRGSIVFSFGSLAPQFPLPLATKFLDVFRQLKDVNVVWRWNVGDEIRSQIAIPSNVRVMKWIPQSDLLASPNVKLFITHCGNSGQYEALYHAVPMIGFPLFVDQKYNAGRMTSKGFGIAMDIYSFTPNELSENVEKVLDDKSYAERIGKASRIFRSSPMSPVERASYWIEHVCRFGGEHLRSGNRQLPMYALWMLDVIAFVVVIAVFVTCATIGLIRTLRGQGNGRKSQENEKTNGNNH